MPNNVKSRLEIVGTKEQVKEVFERFNTHFKEEPRKAFDGKPIYTNKLTDKFGWLDEKTGAFEERGGKVSDGVPEGFEQDFKEAWDRFPDFNKIVPGSEDLNITCDNWIMPLENRFSSDTKLKSHLDKARRVFEEAPDRKEEIMTNLMKGIKNYLNYGHASWYTWNVANWGTKWNSYSCEKESDNVYTFETAWSAVPDLIKLMTESFPDLTFVYEWSCEDTGNNCGKCTWSKGVFDVVEIEDGSKEAYDIAFKLRPHYKDDYKLVGDAYEYIEEE